MVLQAEAPLALPSTEEKVAGGSIGSSNVPTWAAKVKVVLAGTEVFHMTLPLAPLTPASKEINNYVFIPPKVYIFLAEQIDVLKGNLWGGLQILSYYGSNKNLTYLASSDTTY